MDFEKKFPYIACGLVISTLLLLSVHYFPLSEGWWQTYAYLLNNGWKPYVDFPLATPPIFMYANLLLIKLTQLFIVHRIVGVLVFAGIFCLLARWLSSYFARSIAWVAALFAVALRVSDPVFIANDYHTMVDVLTLLVLLSSVRLQDLDTGAHLIWRYALLGGLIGALTLVKQNIGVFLLAAFWVVILCMRTYSIKKKIVAFSVLCLAYVACLVGISSLYSHDLCSSLFGQVAANDAKGSKFTVLTRIFLDSANSVFLISSIGAYLFFLMFRKVEDLFELPRILGVEKVRTLELLCLGCGFLLLTAKSSLSLPSIVSTMSITACLVVFLHIMYGALLRPGYAKYQESEIVVVPLLALAYCNTQTASFNYVGMFFALAFCFAYVAEAFGMAERTKMRLLMVAVLVFCMCIGVKKTLKPYSWWGLGQGSIYTAVYPLPYTQLAGYRVDKKTRDAYQVIKDAVDRYAIGEKDAYFFPNIPIFYYLHHKFPPYSNLVQWFDFATDKQIVSEFSAFKRNLPPLIVVLDPPGFVYTGHFELRKKRLQQVLFRDSFDELLISGQYKQVYAGFYDDSFDSDDPSSDNLITRSLVVTNSALVGMDYSALSKFLNYKDFEIDGLMRQNLKVLPEVQKVQIGDTIDVTFEKKIASNLVRSIGYIYKEPTYFTLRVLVRSDNPALTSR